MTGRARRAALGLLTACLITPAAASAHRLDEYLQAARLAIDSDRVTIDLDLTPGVSVWPRIRPLIDTDGDGRISVLERDAYARQVIASLTLSLDGRPLAITLTSSQSADADAFGEGLGMMRLKAEAATGRVGAGRHRLAFANAHQPETSVYLVNALLPGDPRISISTQLRDPAQHRLDVDYKLAPRPWTRAVSVGAGVAAIGLLAALRRRTATA